MNNHLHVLGSARVSFRTRFLLTDSILFVALTTWFIACLFFEGISAGAVFGGFAVMLSGGLTIPYLSYKRKKQCSEERIQAHSKPLNT